MSSKELAEIAASISAAERRAMAAERETFDRLIAGYLAGQVGAEFKARISGATRSVFSSGSALARTVSFRWRRLVRNISVSTKRIMRWSAAAPVKRTGLAIA